MVELILIRVQPLRSGSGSIKHPHLSIPIACSLAFLVVGVSCMVSRVPSGTKASGYARSVNPHVSAHVCTRHGLISRERAHSRPGLGPSLSKLRVTYRPIRKPMGWNQWLRPPILCSMCVASFADWPVSLGCRRAALIATRARQDPSWGETVARFSHCADSVVTYVSCRLSHSKASRCMLLDSHMRCSWLVCVSRHKSAVQT